MLTGLHPSRAEVLHTRSLEFFKQDRLDEAIEALGQALQIRPDFELAQQNLKLALGNKIFQCGNASAISTADGELDALAAAVCRKQQSSKAWEALSLKYYEKKNYAAAEICLQNAAIHSDGLTAAEKSRFFTNLMIVALDLRKPESARAYAAEATKIEPNNQEISKVFAKAHGNHLADLTYDPYVSRQEISEQHCAWGEWHRLPGKPYRHEKKHYSSARRIRLGFVSADFYSHPVGIFLFSILELLDTSRFEVACYAEIRVDDSLTKAIRSRSQIWRQINALTDVELAERIYQDEVDILIDLSGHTGGNRLRAFTLRPAPIQMSFIGYWDTTGVAEMDYLVTDGYTVPEGDNQFFTETVLRMPGSRFCYRPPAFAPEIALKKESELIVFGCFNNDKKLNDEVIACWARILAAVPESRLFLKWKTYNEQQRVDRLYEQFQRFGIGPEKLIIEGASTYDVLLGLYNTVDLALDTFPFTGGLTTCDALWMGVPVVTLDGGRPVGRQSASFLHVMGASELIAPSIEEYIALAVALAKDRDRLNRYKQKLRRQMAESTLLRPEAYTREFEKLLVSCYSKLIEKSGAWEKSAASANKVKVISATRLDENGFWKGSLLGKALRNQSNLQKVRTHIVYANTSGLPEIYNKAIDDANDGDILIFVHDDVAIEDADFLNRVQEGLEFYDVIGVAGNRRRIPNQPAWIFSHIDQNHHLAWDKEYLSGAIDHSLASGETIKNFYGRVPEQVKLLDGVLLAVKASTLKNAEVRFDPRFKFHFYDQDFCRSCERAGLSMGTWPLTISHASDGAYGNKAWLASYAEYLEKWGS